jgi:peptide/nickel transport system substrate-binding protein
VVRWSSPYPDASALTEPRDGSLEPLPRHLLEQPFGDFLQDPTAKDRFLNLPFWTSEYVGAGPSRLQGWEPGYQLVGVAFDGHVLGRPKIGRIIMRLFADENTALASVLAGATIDITTRFTLRFEHAMVLKREWEAAGRGVVLMGQPSAPVSNVFQFRREFQRTPELLDVRVRKALAHAMDRQAIVDGLYDGVGEVPDTFVSRGEPYYNELDRNISKYPHDPRRAEQYLEEAGLTKDRAGFFSNRAGERFAPEHQTTANVLTSKANTIVDEGWRRLGIDVQPSVLPAAQDRDLQVRHSFPGIATVGTSAADQWPSSEIGTPEKRWAGQNRGGWSHPDYDRLWDGYHSSLDRTERSRHMVGLAKIVSEEVPGLFLYYAFMPTYTHISALRGPDVGSSGTTSHWNIHEWELR